MPSTKCNYSSLLKLFWLKCYSTVLIRIHSYVNIGMRQDIGKPTQSLHCGSFNNKKQDLEVVPVYAGSNTFNLQSESSLINRSSHHGQRHKHDKGVALGCMTSWSLREQKHILALKCKNKKTSTSFSPSSLHCTLQYLGL